MDMGPRAGPRELAGAQVDAPSQRDHYQEGTGGRTRREAGRVGLQEGLERRARVGQEWTGMEAWPWWPGARGHQEGVSGGGTWDLMGQKCEGTLVGRLVYMLLA